MTVNQQQRPMFALGFAAGVACTVVIIGTLRYASSADHAAAAVGATAAAVSAFAALLAVLLRRVP